MKLTQHDYVFSQALQIYLCFSLFASLLVPDKLCASLSLTIFIPGGVITDPTYISFSAKKLTVSNFFVRFHIFYLVSGFPHGLFVSLTNLSYENENPWGH